MNLLFANQDDEDAIYPLTTREIAEAQKHDIELNTMTDKDGYSTQLVENTKVLCKNGKMAIKARYNLALGYEMKDDLDTAIQWLAAARQIATDYRSKDDLKMIAAYQKVLTQRQKEIDRLNNM